MYRNVLADGGVGHKFHTLGRHLLQAAIDNVLFEFKLGDAVAKQAANAVRFLIDGDSVPGTTELLGCGEAGWTRSDDGHFLAGTMFSGLGTNPSFKESAFDDVLLVLLDRHWRLINPQHARRFARRRTNASGKLREIIGRMQLAHGILPVAVVHLIIPVGNEIADRATGLAERNTAIHAARTLLAQLVFGKVLINLEPVVHPFQHRSAWCQFAWVVDEAGCLTHAAPARRSPEQRPARRGCRHARTG